MSSDAPLIANGCGTQVHEGVPENCRAFDEAAAKGRFVLGDRTLATVGLERQLPALAMDNTDEQEQLRSGRRRFNDPLYAGLGKE